MKKFLRFLLVSISIFILLTVGQQMVVKQGPVSVLADEDACESDPNQLGCSNPGTWEGGLVPDEPEPTPAPAPVSTPPAGGPSCGDFSFRYNECFACKKSRAVHQDSCGVYRTEENAGEDQACASWCPAPTPTPAPTCPRIDVVRTEQDCVGDQWCTFNVWQGPKDDGSCQYGRGGAYGCQRVAGRCGYNPAPQPTPAPVVVPVTTPPAQCSTQMVRTNQRCQGNQLCRFNVHQRCDGTTYESGAYGCYNSLQCGYTTAPTCTPSSRQETTCIGTQLCIVEVRRSASCNINRSNPFGCQNSTQCGFRAPLAPIQTGGGNAAVGTVVSTSNAQGGNAVVNIQQPRETREVRVVTAGATEVKQLPKTGLPVLAWVAGAFLPLGMRMKRFNKGISENLGDPNYLWELRNFSR